MAISGMEFFPQIDRSQNRSATGETAKGQQAKKDVADAMSFSDALNDRVSGGSSAPVKRSKEQHEAPIQEQRRKEASYRGERPSEETNERKTALKQRAVLDFMSEMQTRFGIAPEKIVTAFSELDEDSLQGRPEEAMVQFMQNLRIPSDRFKEAASLYKTMVQETGDGELQRRLAGDGQQAVKIQVLDPKDHRLERLQRSIEAMNDRFFQSGIRRESEDQVQGLALSAMIDGNDGASDDTVLNLGGADKGRQQAGQDKQKLMTMATETASAPAGAKEVASLMSMASASGIAPTEATSMKSPFSIAGKGKSISPGLSMSRGELDLDLNLGEIPTGDVGKQRGIDQLSQLTALRNVEGGVEQTFPESPSDLETMSSATGSQAGFAPLASSDQAMDMASMGLAGIADASVRASDATSSEEGDSKSTRLGADSASVTMATVTSPSKDGREGTSPADMLIRQPVASSEQQKENIQNLINQAQIIMKRGGGEMKLQLQPEGMGQVHLNVLVQDGQVNVQMLTENDGAKKLLENGLSELKSQLAAHKLHVETLKIDSIDLGAGLRKFEQQANSDASREQARQFASDFLGQFHDERQAMRQGWADNPGFRSYGRQQKRATIEASPTEAVKSSAATAGTRRSDASSRRLNLVA